MVSANEPSPGVASSPPKEARPLPLRSYATGAAVSRLGAVKRWMYRNDLPHRLAALLNRGWTIVASAGLGPKRLATLEVRGRRSGHLISFPVMVADYRGERYLVSMLGEGAK